jgi:hypothetical protein
LLIEGAGIETAGVVADACMIALPSDFADGDSGAAGTPAGTLPGGSSFPAFVPRQPGQKAAITTMAIALKRLALLEHPPPIEEGSRLTD